VTALLAGRQRADGASSVVLLIEWPNKAVTSSSCPNRAVGEAAGSGGAYVMRLTKEPVKGHG
jgi:hypothetical protein